jgi:hypothetical protein
VHRLWFATVSSDSSSPNAKATARGAVCDGAGLLSPATGGRAAAQAAGRQRNLWCCWSLFCLPADVPQRGQRRDGTVSMVPVSVSVDQWGAVAGCGGCAISGEMVNVGRAMACHHPCYLQPLLDRSGSHRLANIAT